MEQYEGLLVDMNIYIGYELNHAYAFYLRGIFPTNLGENQGAMNDLEITLETGFDGSTTTDAREQWNALKE